MPDPVIKDPVAIIQWATLIKTLVGSIIGGAIAVVAFFSKFQTKGNCDKAHKDHDKLLEEKEEGYKKDLRNLELKISSLKENTDIKLEAIHASTIRQEKLVEKIADKVWE